MEVVEVKVGLVRREVEVEVGVVRGAVGVEVESEEEVIGMEVGLVEWRLSIAPFLSDPDPTKE
jgi:hypothetical protein